LALKLAGIRFIMNQLLTLEQKIDGNHVASLSPALNKAPPLSENLLIAYSGKLLRLIQQTKRGKPQEDTPGKFQKQALQALHAFREKTVSTHYDANTLFVSQYVLMATLDEMLEKMIQKYQLDWTRTSFTQDLSSEGSPEENFFTILEKASQSPQQFIDLLELIYLCLTLGFEGKYQHLSDGHTTLNEIKHRTYQLIQAYRGEFDKKLSPGIKLTPSLTCKKTIHHLPFWAIILMGIVCLIGIDFLFRYLLQICGGSIVQQLQKITQIGS